MKIKSIYIKNYKSIKEARIENLGDFNVFIGKNNRGKSNILKALDLFFNWRDSRDYDEVLREKPGNQKFDPTQKFDATTKDYRLLFGQKQGGVIKINVKLELSQSEIRELFPDEEVKYVDNITHSRSDLINNAVIISKKISIADKTATCQVNYVKTDKGTTLMEHDDIHKKYTILVKTKGGYYSLGGEGEHIGTKVLEQINQRFLIVPAVRHIEKESRNLKKASLDGSGMPSEYLRYEKDHSLSKRPVFTKIKDGISDIFSDYQNIESMEDGEGNVEVHFGDFPSSSVGSGINQIFITIFNIDSHNDVIFGIEEPESHLHPEVQRKVFNFLKEQSKEKQIFITTHSPIFASGTQLKNVRLVTKDNAAKTHITPITKTNVYRIIEELGVRPSDIFDDDVVIFVEGKSDVGIFQEFVKKLKPNSKTGFIDAESWTSMGYYANAKILQSKKVKIPVFVVFDGDTENGEKRRKIKERLVNELDLPSTHIKTLSKNSIEDYLLVPRAIKEAFPDLKISEDEIKKFIEENKTKKNKKRVLDKMFKAYGLGKYKEKYGIKIAKAMKEDEIDPEIKNIIQNIVNTVK